MPEDPGRVSNGHLNLLTGGEMRSRIASFDWSRTPLGPAGGWPRGLRSAVEIMLTARYPMLVWWGPQLIQFYNDAHVPALGQRHPRGLGKPAAMHWAEAWPLLGALAHAVMTQGVSTWSERLEMAMTRNGFPEEVYMTLSCSPIPGEAGAIEGLFCACTDETQRVLGDRRLAALAALGDRTASARAVGHVCEATMAVLADIPRDLPFALLYLLDEEQRTARLMGRTGLEARTPASPMHVNLEDGDEPWPFSRVLAQGVMARVADLPDGPGRVFPSPWPEPTRMAVVLPLARSGYAGLAGFLVAGLSPRLVFDESYRTFLDLLAREVATALAAARAHEHERESERILREKEVWLAAQEEAFRAAMDEAPLEVSLGVLTDAVASHADDSRRCAFYIGDEAGCCLRHVVGMPDAYARALDGFLISPESLACGLAVASGEPVITRDILEDPRWEAWTWLARDFGYRGCWSFPVETATGRLVGSFAIYLPEPGEPDARDVELVAAITQAAAIIISRHQETEERLRSEERLRQFGEASQDVLWIRDAGTLQWQYLTPAFETIYGLSRHEALNGDNFRSWLDLIVAEDRDRASSLIARVIQGESVSFEYRVRRPDGKIRWLRSTDFPIRGRDGQVERIGGIGQDITARREWEERQKVLITELQHRTRNLMAVVRSTAEKTVRSSAGLADFRVRFRDRLEALSRVQGLLSRLHAHDRVTFDELIRTELSAVEGSLERVMLQGPAGIRLRSSTVQMLAMAVHELATNAVKYGALGQPQALLDVTWSFEPDGPGNMPWLHIDWRESGVEMPLPGSSPGDTGQGRELLEQALPYQLNARTSFTSGPDGVRCTISLPVSNRGVKAGTA